MNIKHYEDIYEMFKDAHPYIADDVVDYRPRGDLGIRLTMRDGKKYDFDRVTKGIRIARDYSVNSKEDITDERCRESFSYHLIEQMGIRGFNQQALAEFTGISKGSINGYINKSKTPSVTNLRKIAYALDCSVSDLID